MYSLEYMYSREYIRIHENTQEYTLYSCVGNTPILCREVPCSQIWTRSLDSGFGLSLWTALWGVRCVM